MNFKNIRAFRVEETPAPEMLHQALKGGLFTECSKGMPYSAGFVPPLQNGELMGHTANGRTLICFQRQEKVIPPASLSELVQKKVAEIKHTESRSVRRKERQQIREEVLFSILPTALIKTTRTWAFFSHGWLFIGEASMRKAEEVIIRLREALESAGLSLRLSLPFPANSPRVVMTEFAATGAPLSIDIGTTFDLEGSSHEVIRCRNEGVDSTAVQEHIRSGFLISKMRMEYDERVEFTLTDDLSLRRISLTDGALEGVDEAEDAEAEFHALFFVTSTEIAGVWNWVIHTFGVEEG